MLNLPVPTFTSSVGLWYRHALNLDESDLASVPSQLIEQCRIQAWHNLSWAIDNGTDTLIEKRLAELMFYEAEYEAY